MRMRAIVTAIALGGMAAVAIAAAPTFTWVRASTAAGFGSAVGVHISAAPDGTSVAAGRFVGSGLDLGDGIARTSGTSGTRWSVFVQRLSATGSVMWARSSTGTGTGQAYARGVASHPDGSSVVTGTIQGTSVDLGDGVTRSTGGPSGFTERFNADGAIAWVSTTSNGSVGNNSASATPDGGTLVAGGVGGVNVDVGSGVLLTSANGGTSASIRVQKFAANGSVMWAHASGSTGASDAQATSVSALPDGTALVTGTFQGAAVDLGDGIVRTSGNAGAENTLFVEKISASGAITWAYTSSATGSNFITGQGVSGLPDGTSVVTGYFRGNGVNFGDGVVRASARGGLDNSVFTLRLRADGTIMWVRTSRATGTSQADGRGVVGRSDGSVVTAGWFSGAAVDLGDGVIRTSGQGGTAASSFTASFATDGTVQWIITSSGGDGTGIDVGTESAAALADGTLLLSGSYMGTAVDLGDGIPRTSPASGTAYSAFVARLAGAPPATAPDPGTPAAAVGDAPATTARLSARVRCASGLCITTGTVPTGARVVRQVAVQRAPATSHTGANARRSTRGRCTTTGRSYRCRVALTPGTWSVTTTAGTAAGTPVAQAVTPVRVRSIRPPAVTG